MVAQAVRQAIRCESDSEIIHPPPAECVIKLAGFAREESSESKLLELIFTHNKQTLRELASFPSQFVISHTIGQYCYPGEWQTEFQ